MILFYLMMMMTGTVSQRSERRCLITFPAGKRVLALSLGHGSLSPSMVWNKSAQSHSSSRLKAQSLQDTIGKGRLDMASEPFRKLPEFRTISTTDPGQVDLTQNVSNGSTRILMQICL